MHYLSPWQESKIHVWFACPALPATNKESGPKWEVNKYLLKKDTLLN